MPFLDNVPRWTRLSTWPLAGFFAGMLVVSPPTDGTSISYWWLISFSVGAILAIALFVAAVVVGRRTPTNTYLPFSGWKPGFDFLFAAIVIACVALKVAGFWGAAQAALGFAAVAIIAWGGKGLAIESEEVAATTKLTRAEMIDRLEAMVADESATDAERKAAADRLTALAKLSG